MSDNPNKPAFPNTYESFTNGNGTYHHAEIGLTKRELFAAMAMQGILASWPAGSRFAIPETTIAAVGFADGLIEALEQEHQG